MIDSKVLIAVLSMIIAMAAGCTSRKAVKFARDGHSIGGNGICIVYSDRYQIRFGGLERLHPFDIRKYERIYQALVQNNLIAPADIFVPAEVGREDLLRVHTQTYLDRNLKSSSMLARYLEIGFLAITLPSLTDAAILRPFRYATGGTILASDLALEHGIAINLGGGYHHAEPDQGGGFCVYADMPIAVRRLQAQGRVKRVLMIDVDVHQGNGTAVCLASDPDIFTFDLYEDDIYPRPKEKNDLDVPLEPGLDDDEYLEILQEHLPVVFEQAKPDMIFLQAGVDSLEGDPLANLNLSVNGIIRRDEMIFEEARRRHIPIVMTLGGGYSDNAWRGQFESIRNIIRVFGSVRSNDQAEVTD